MNWQIFNAIVDAAYELGVLESQKQIKAALGLELT